MTKTSISLAPSDASKTAGLGFFERFLTLWVQNVPCNKQGTKNLDVGNTTSLRQSLLRSHWQLATEPV